MTSFILSQFPLCHHVKIKQKEKDEGDDRGVKCSDSFYSHESIGPFSS